MTCSRESNFFGQEIEKLCKGQCPRAFALAICSLTITDAHNFGAIRWGIFFLDIFFGHFFWPFFFWTYFLAIFLGQLLKAALLDFFFLKITRFDCLAVCVSGTSKRFFFCIFGQNLIWTIFLRNFFGHFFCPIYLALTEFYNFLAKKNALPKLGLFRRLLTLLMEPFVVRLVCFASPLFARSRSGRVELGRIRYSDPVLVLSESDEVP